MDSPSHLEALGRFRKEGRGHWDWEFGSTEGLAGGKGCGQRREGQSRVGKTTSREATSLASYCPNPRRERESRQESGCRQARARHPAQAPVPSC